ncbi:hypothetical protein D9M68_834020 [compost metagenome]
MTGDHIGRNGPGSATEAQQRCFIGELLAEQPNRLIDRLQPFGDTFSLKPEYLIGIDWRHQWTLAFFKAKVSSKGMRDNQNI